TDLSPSLKVFPNPTEGICTVRIGTPLTEPVKVEVINTDGRIMQSLGWKDPLEMSDLRIDLTNYPAGAYFLRLSGKSTTGAQVLVKR
ncbi:MAG: T9SS type A sorting domain-containing protein, partial [Saprospiraceae bacterium]|nr:T9SS type A sorting domain-containing protein [Saprospiraceae bacterium]